MTHSHTHTFKVGDSLTLTCHDFSYLAVYSKTTKAEVTAIHSSNAVLVVYAKTQDGIEYTLEFQRKS
jgi:hypothetical protein